MVRIGNINVTSIGGQVAWTAVSDGRMKTDIRDLELGLDFVKALRPVSYRMYGGNDRIDMGFVAQDVEDLLGDRYNVVAAAGGDENLRTLRHADLIAPLVKALQEQQQIIEPLMKRLQEQQQIIEPLMKTVQELQAEVRLLKTDSVLRAAHADSSIR
jgi:trimeric autotransporter adhesin